MTDFAQHAALNNFMDSLQRVSSLEEFLCVFKSLRFPPEMKTALVKSVRTAFTSQLADLRSDPVKLRSFTLSNFSLSVVPTSILANIILNFGFVDVMAIIPTSKHFQKTIVSVKKTAFRSLNKVIFSITDHEKFSTAPFCRFRRRPSLINFRICRDLRNTNHECDRHAISKVVSLCATIETIKRLAVYPHNRLEVSFGGMEKNREIVSAHRRLLFRADRLEVLAIGIANTLKEYNIEQDDRFQATCIECTDEDIPSIVSRRFPNVNSISFELFDFHPQIEYIRESETFVERLRSFPDESVRNQLLKIENVKLFENLRDGLRHCVYLIWWCENLKELSCILEEDTYGDFVDGDYDISNEMVLRSWIHTRGMNQRKMDKIMFNLGCRLHDLEPTTKQKLTKFFQAFGITVKDLTF